MSKLIKVILVLAVLGLMFGIGTYTGANTDWKTEVINKSNSRLGKVGHDKKEEIINRDVSDEMVKTLDPMITEMEEELARLLDEYYQMKIEGLSDVETVSALETEIREIQQIIFERYKLDVDAMFGG